MTRFRVLVMVLTSLCAAFFIADKSSAQAELVVNGGFETGDRQGWTDMELPGSEGGWLVYDASAPYPIPPPAVGSFAVVTIQVGPGSKILFQDIEVPSGGAYACSVIVYYNNRAIEFVNGPGLFYDRGPNQQARLDIISTDADPFTVAAGVFLNIFRTLPGDPQQLGYTTLNFDLSQFAGDTVRFRAAEVDNLAEFHFAFDELTCVPAPAPGIPTLGEWGMMAMAGVLGIAGLLYARRKRAAAV